MLVPFSGCLKVHLEISRLFSFLGRSMLMSESAALLSRGTVLSKESLQDATRSISGADTTVQERVALQLQPHRQ